MAKPAVLFVGSAGVGKTLLLKEVLRYEQLCIDKRSCSENGEIGDISYQSPPREVQIHYEGQHAATFNELDWISQTKYYSAELTLWDLQEVKQEDILLAALADCDNIEGLVLVYDPRQNQTFEDLRVWFEISSMKDCEFKVCLAAQTWKGLCADDKSSDRPLEISSQQQENKTFDFQRAIETCLDKGFEFIFADLLDPVKGHDLREKDGVPRLIEALQSTQWSNMELHPKPQQTKTQNEVLPETPTIPPEPPAEEIPKPTNQPETSAADTKEQPEDFAQNLDSLSQNLFSDDGLFEDDTMAKLIHEVQRIRDSSQNMPDSQRREVASAAALKLLEILDIDDGDDSPNEKET